MYSHNRRQYNHGRPRKRMPMPSHPLPRSLGARRAGDAFLNASADEGASARPNERPAAKPRGLRGVAFFIIGIVPLSVAVWAMSIVVPVVIEAREAMDEVFVPTVERTHFDDVQPTPPSLPSSATEDGTSTGVPSTPDAAAAEYSPTPTSTAAPDATPSPLASTATPYPAWDGDDPVHILLLGVDSRPGDENPPRSDTLIVVRVDPGLERVDMFSVPRDLLVEIPDYRSHKINAAYVLGEEGDLPGGGPILAAQTIEYNFGIRIDYFATIDISGMQRMVDEIGGVIVDVDAPIKDDQYPTEDYRYTRAYFASGLQKMNGVEAVRYARTRHDDNDFKRSERQQEMLFAIRNQVLVSGVITKLPELIAEIGDSVRTDLSPRQVLSLARFGQDLPRDQIFTHSINDYLEERYIDEEFFFVADWPAVRGLVQNLPDDPASSNIPGQEGGDETP